MRRVALPKDIETVLERIVSEYNRSAFLLVFSIRHNMGEDIIRKYFTECEKLAIKKNLCLEMIGREYGATPNNKLFVDFSTEYLEIYE